MRRTMYGEYLPGKVFEVEVEGKDHNALRREAAKALMIKFTGSDEGYTSHLNIFRVKKPSLFSSLPGDES